MGVLDVEYNRFRVWGLQSWNPRLAIKEHTITVGALMRLMMYIPALLGDSGRPG